MATAPPPPPPHHDRQGGEAYEAAHVHAVYDAIAPHFSATRHRPWPAVAAFLRARPPGAVGLDVGCGNGKYLRVNPAVHLLGSDRSAALVRLARDGPPPPATEAPRGADGEAAGAQRRASTADVFVADGLALPHRAAAFDFAICVAVVHHLSTRDRRRDALRELLRCVRDGGRVLVFVWALEQAGSRRGFDEGDAQDTLVPWVMKTPRPSKGGGGGGEAEGAAQQPPEPDRTYQRYYHLYRRGELDEDVVAAGGTVVESGYERDNWWAICSKQQGG